MSTFRTPRRLAPRATAASSSFTTAIAKLEQEREAADSTSSPLGNSIFGGPLIGTHIGDPIA